MFSHSAARIGGARSDMALAFIRKPAAGGAAAGNGLLVDPAGEAEVSRGQIEDVGHAEQRRVDICVDPQTCGHPVEARWIDRADIGEGDRDLDRLA